MSPPDTNQEKQKRRHRGPLIGIALVVLFGAGIILYWIAEEAFMAPGPDEATEETQEAIPTTELPEGDVEVPADAPTETVEPTDPEVEIEPDIETEQ